MLLPVQTKLHGVALNSWTFLDFLWTVGVILRTSRECFFPPLKLYFCIFQALDKVFFIAYAQQRTIIKQYAS